LLNQIDINAEHDNNPFYLSNDKTDENKMAISKFKNIVTANQGKQKLITSNDDQSNEDEDEPVKMFKKFNRQKTIKD